MKRDATIEWYVSKLDCESEASRIRELLDNTPAVSDFKVFPHSAKVLFTIDENVTDRHEIKYQLERLGFPVLPSRQIASTPPPWRNPKVLVSMASGIFLGFTYLSANLGLIHDGISSLLYLSGILLGGYYFGREAVEMLYRTRVVGIELLMSAAAIAAFILGEGAEALTLVFLYSISEAFESYTEDKTRNAIKELMNLAPDVATIIRDEEETEITVDEIVEGDIFLVRPGQSIPTDGIVERGESSVNEASVTGESIPVAKSSGDLVFAATIAIDGALEVKATRTVVDNTLARIIRHVEDAQEQKPELETFIQRFGKLYSPVVLIGGLLIFLVPGFITGLWHEWAVHATVFVVAASPCALIISVPITMVAALGTGARIGILIKGGKHMEALARARVVAFDKTGTLTMGKPQVCDILPVYGQEGRHILSLAASVERYSQHPLAQVITDEARRRSIELLHASNFRSHTSQGVSAEVDGSHIFVGNPAWFTSKSFINTSDVDDRVAALQSEGKTVVLVCNQSTVVGIIALRDGIRHGVKDAILKLREIGIERAIMLTGDHAATAAAIASEAGVDEFHANLKPEEKARTIQELEVKYGGVMMIGDGVNDAPAIATASVGVAMGVIGTDVALETADVALMADDLSKLPKALQLSKRARRVIRQNLVVSMIIIAVLATGSIIGGFTMPIVILSHELSELLVIINGLRLLKT